MRKWLNMIYIYIKKILIMMALVIEYPLLHTIPSALCIPQIERGISRRLFKLTAIY